MPDLSGGRDKDKSKLMLEAYRMTPDILSSGGLV